MTQLTIAMNGYQVGTLYRSLSGTHELFIVRAKAKLKTPHTTGFSLAWRRALGAQRCS